MPDTTAPHGTLKLATPIFGPPVTNPYGLKNVGNSANPSFVDIDADGDLDAYVGNRDGSVWFFLNKGSANSPAFAKGVLSSYGQMHADNYASPCLVDIDGDSDLDAFVGDGSGNILLFLNNDRTSSSSFAGAVKNPYGLSAAGYNANPSLVDIDGDGDLDAFVGSSFGEIQFFLNTGSASSPAFAEPVTNPYGLSGVSVSSSPDFVDIDADGDLDAVVGNSDGDTLISLNTGSAISPAFAAPVTNPYGLSGVSGSANPAFVDIDADGDLDAFIGSYYGNTIVFLGNEFASSVGTSTTSGTYGEGSVITLTVAFNENVLVNTTGGIPRLKLETGTTDRFATYSGGSGTQTLTFSYTVQTGDFSADLDISSRTALTLNGGTIRDAAGNNADLFLAAPGATGSLAANAALVIGGVAPHGALAGTPVFSSPITNAYGLRDVGQDADPSFVDIDGDGDLDALVGEVLGNTLVFLNTGSARYPAFAAPVRNPYGLRDVVYNASPSFVDIDADGDLDAFVGNNYGNTQVFLNTGSASSPAFAVPIINLYGLSYAGAFTTPSLGDIDGDGDLDAFVGNYSGNTLVFLNTGSVRSPAFAAPVINPYGLSDVGLSSSPSLRDIDNDGDLDALVGERFGNTLLFLNTGSARNPAFAAPVTNPYGLDKIVSYVGYKASPSLVDIDGDGDLDALVGDSYGNTLVFLNTGSFVAPVSSGSSNGIYVPGDVITLNIAFNDKVLVDTTGGTPTLQLETGETDRFAIYSGGSGTKTLTFSYIVQAGDISADLDIFSSSALTLNGGSIKNALGNNAILILAKPGAIGSLAANAALVVIPGLSINGGNSNDSISGSAGHDTLNGLSGDDTLNGGLGNDSLVGGAGIDTASYADATGPVVASLSGAGSATGADGTDVLSAIENLTGSAYADSLTGNTAANRLEGGAGNDSLNGGSNTDTLLGGAGDDQYTVDNIADVVTENLNEGADTVLSSISFVLSANVENLRLTAATAINATGNSLNNILWAGAGDNILDGSSGIDTVSFAYSGDDITASLSSRRATGGSGNDNLTSIENLIGSNHADNLTGNTQTNRLEGGQGNDTLNGGSGADTLLGGTGSDQYIVDNAGDVITENPDAGTDIVYASISYSLTANVENLRINSTASINATGNELNNTLFAGAGNNVLNGAGGNDTVSYANISGAVTVSLATEATQATGSAGSDTLISIENITGSNYNDTLQGSNADNIIDGGNNIDTVSYANASSAVTASLASKSASGGGGNDTLLRIENLIGSSYNDILTGSSVANVLTGGGGNDSFNGSKGNDTLDAGEGNDTLLGGAGQDQLTGGAGADIFDFNTLAEMGITSASWDSITDFSGAEGDRVDLSTLDANTTTGGNQSFSFIGSASFTTAGQLRYDAAAGMLYGSVDADLDAEFAIQLVGNPAFTGVYLVA